LQKQQYPYDPTSSQASDRLKSQKQPQDKRQYDDQIKFQNYVQHLKQEETIREKQRQQLTEQRLALQNYQDQQRYELEQLQRKQQSQLHEQQRSRQELQYSSRQPPLPSFQPKPSGSQGMPSSSNRDKQMKQSRSQQNPYMMPNYGKQESKLDPLHQYPLHYDLTQHIKSQDYQHQQALYNQRSSEPQNKPSRQPSDLNVQQYHQSQQQLAETMRRHQQGQQSQQMREQSRPSPVQESPRVTNERQKSQPVKKRQYNPASQAPAPPPAPAPPLQVSTQLNKL
jgi:hypothetical protein